MLIGMRNAMLAGGAAPGPTPAYWGLCFTAEEPGAIVNMRMTGAPTNTVGLQTSFDGVNWVEFKDDGTTPVTLARVGDRVYFKSAPHAGEATNRRFATSNSNYRSFTLSKRCAASGNIMSILDGEDPFTEFRVDAIYAFGFLFADCTFLTAAPALPAVAVKVSVYRYMFSGCSSLVTAPALPATVLANNCYYGMFSGCTSLVSAPQLPAAGLGANCYGEMFQGCTSLTSAPSLPATALKPRCYYRMFYGCTSLTTAPALPATTLVNSCYNSMFSGCTSLTTAPALPATTLETYCYPEMFYGCSSLTTVEVGFAAFSPTDATTNWLSGVAASGTFYCPTALGTDATITRGVSACPEGWTVVNTDA